MSERITYTTTDDVIIGGDWVPAPTVLGAVILFHMMPATRSSWTELQQELAKRSIASLAIDLRGHGESTKDTDGNVLDYQKFSDEESAATELDVTGAIRWVRTRNLECEQILLGGASFGANLALLGLTTEPRIPGAFLLSPGKNYHGVQAFDAMGNLLPHQQLWIAASEEDTESFADSRKITENAPVDQKTFVPYRNAGHGTELLVTDRTLSAKIADWVFSVIRG